MTLKKKYFKNGYILTTRNGFNYVVMNFAHYTDFEHKNKCEDVLCNLELYGYLESNYFNDNMEAKTGNSDWDIVKVAICNYPVNIFDTQDDRRYTIWERED